MNTALPEGRPSGGFIALELDSLGRYVSPISGVAVPEDGVEHFLSSRLRVPPDVTDIIVWVHGWRNSPEQARDSACRLFAAIDRLRFDQSGMYPHLTEFKAMYISVQWPSQSNPFPWGYRMIRDRAHRMTTNGYAEFSLAQLLGYLDARRLPPSRARNILQTSGGQYLHCVGHSFGGRFLGEAISAAPRPQRRILSLLPKNRFHAFTVDTFLVFQMAAKRNIFASGFSELLNTGPLQGPICLTFSSADRACSLWHPLAERGHRAIGARGASKPRERIIRTQLRGTGEHYQREELASPIVNIDAGSLYRRGRLRRIEGAHSDFWYPESIHLLLTLADYARP